MRTVVDMSTITAWIRGFGTAGAVVNARLAIDRSNLATHAVDELVGRLPAATALPERSNGSA